MDECRPISSLAYTRADLWKILSHATIGNTWRESTGWNGLKVNWSWAQGPRFWIM
jgi:hypothetical protein